MAYAVKKEEELPLASLTVPETSGLQMSRLLILLHDAYQIVHYAVNTSTRYKIVCETTSMFWMFVQLRAHTLRMLLEPTIW